MKRTLINEQVSVKKEKKLTRNQRKVKTITVATSNVKVLFCFPFTIHTRLCCATLITYNALQIV